uniref:ubiquitin carboxyl-terminal hydrolase isozyme L1 isoform X2 n=1 Tax=Scatophagus argus TaxID=75038 RepID=UPI001ED82945|nr:ubiquitin carboxyl-terminal hydrolase isozyme L1 isoform X2 [Scatophagus argus]
MSQLRHQLMKSLGVGESWRFVDVVGLESEQLTAVPKPCCALMLLFPLTQQHDSFRQQQADKVAGDSELYFLKQTAVHSCGTIALLHAVANNKSKLSFATDSVLKKFLDETADMSADDRAKHLEKNQAICKAHNEVASQGQCRPEADNINFHFIAFVNVNGQLYEFDGRMNGPVKHGATNDESFIVDAAKVCHEFMEREQGEVRFSSVALCHS